MDQGCDFFTKRGVSGTFLIKEYFTLVGFSLQRFIEDLIDLTPALSIQYFGLPFELHRFYPNLRNSITYCDCAIKAN